MSQNWKPNWKKGEVIRQIYNGKPFLVIHIFKIEINQTSTLVIDLENRTDPSQVYIISQGEYDKYIRDKDINDFKQHN